MNKASWALHLKWIAVLVSMMVLPAYGQLMIGHMGHSGGDDCNIKSGPIPLNYSVYEKPKGALPPTMGHCKHVPNIGEHLVTIDLQGSKSREIPIGIRLVLVEGGQNKTIMSKSPELYSSGTINFGLNFKELGQYHILLETKQNEIRLELFNLKFRKSSGQLDNTSRISILKKDLARILTYRNQLKHTQDQSV